MISNRLPLGTLSILLMAAYTGVLLTRPSMSRSALSPPPTLWVASRIMQMASTSSKAWLTEATI